MSLKKGNSAKTGCNPKTCWIMFSQGRCGFLEKRKLAVFTKEYLANSFMPSEVAYAWECKSLTLSANTLIHASMSSCFFTLPILIILPGILYSMPKQKLTCSWSIAPSGKLHPLQVCQSLIPSNFQSTRFHIEVISAFWCYGYFTFWCSLWVPFRKNVKCFSNS